MQRKAPEELLADAVKESLSEGLPVNLEGLGVLVAETGGLRFIADTAPRVFVSYVCEEAVFAMRLANDLEASGMKPWLDRRKLLPGQDWRSAIERAIERADFFVPCLSRRALRKRGQFPYELRTALRCADRMPLGDNFIVPVRLEKCDVPLEIQSQIQYVDLFPDWGTGSASLIESLWSEMSARRLRDAA